MESGRGLRFGRRTDWQAIAAGRARKAPETRQEPRQAAREAKGEADGRGRADAVAAAGDSKTRMFVISE